MTRLRLVVAALAVALVAPGILAALCSVPASHCAMPKPAAHSCCDAPPLLQQAAASCCEVRPAAPARLPQAPETARVEAAVAVLAHATPIGPALSATGERHAAPAPARPPDLLAQLGVLRI